MRAMLQEVTSAEKLPQTTCDRVMLRPHVGSVVEFKSCRVSQALKLSMFQDDQKCENSRLDHTKKSLRDMVA